MILSPSWGTRVKEHPIRSPRWDVRPAEPQSYSLLFAQRLISLLAAAGTQAKC